MQASEVRRLNSWAYIHFGAQIASDSGEKRRFGFHFKIQFL